MKWKINVITTSLLFAISNSYAEYQEITYIEESNNYFQNTSDMQTGWHWQSYNRVAVALSHNINQNRNSQFRHKDLISIEDTREEETSSEDTNFQFSHKDLISLEDTREEETSDENTNNGQV